MSSISRRGEAGAAAAPIEAWLTKPVKRSQLYDSLAELVSTEVAVVEVPEPALHPLAIHSASCASASGPLRGGQDLNQTIATHQLHKLGYRSDVVPNK